LVGALQAQEKGDLTSLSVDDLMNVEVTSMARKEQKLSETPAAVFVITQEDIRRSGATSIAEILRSVPGLDVARVSGNSWAITARGFNSRFANKLLVLIDGRLVYTALFGGVYWDVQDTLLDDIERIEVLRGPGGTLWGANAVNGIVNIITKHSVDTQGTLVTAGGGAQEGPFLSARHGGSLGHNAYYRAYAKSFDRPATMDAGGGGPRSFDGWNALRAGFRTDWDTRNGDTFTAQGDLYRGSSAQVDTLVNMDDPFAGARFDLSHVSGANALFRWSQTQSSRSDTSLQVYYDDARRAQLFLDEETRQFDVDFQHHLKAGSSDVVWGTAFLLSTTRALSLQPVIAFTEPRDKDLTATAFVQDEIRLSNRLRVTIGSKLQYDRKARYALEPTVRALFTLGPQQTIWAAASSSLRAPSESELAARSNLAVVDQPRGKPAFLVVFGNDALHSERINAYEVGYRWASGHGMSLDATAFHNDLENIHGSMVGGTSADSSGRTIIPIAYTDNQKGHANGAELFATVTPAVNWNLTLGYSLFRIALLDAQGRNEGSTPEHQAQLRSFVKLRYQVELNAVAFYVARISDGNVPSYVRLDVNLAWHPVTAWEFSIAAHNLLQAHHTEFADDSTLGSSTPVQRSVYGKVTWRF